MIPAWHQALRDAHAVMFDSLPAGRATALALTKLDEARLWAQEAERVADADAALAEDEEPGPPLGPSRVLPYPTTRS